MKKYLVLYAVAVTALFVCSHRRYRAENRRLVQNQTALTAEVAHYRTQAGQEAASAQVLRLRCGEFEALRAADAEEIRRLRLKIRRLEAAAKTVTATEAEIRTPLRDTVVVRSGDPHPVRDSVRLFRHRRGAHRTRLGRVPHPQHRHPAAGGPPHPPPLPLHPLGHEGAPAGDRLDEPPHADRPRRIRENRTVRRKDAERIKRKNLRVFPFFSYLWGRCRNGLFRGAERFAEPDSDSVLNPSDFFVPLEPVP